MRPFGCHLFLSANPTDVAEALDSGMAAASILPAAASPNRSSILKFAFDGDAVIFSDEAERVYQQEGLAVFAQTEQDSANKPLSGGPFKPFLSELHRIQSEFPRDESPIRTALVTARSAPAHERVIKTLRAWNIRLDESLFLGGMSKAQFLSAYEADIFFDDQSEHCQLASEVVPSGHVLHGVRNRDKDRG
jgi:5'-nucleotidase